MIIVESRAQELDRFISEAVSNWLNATGFLRVIYMGHARKLIAKKREIKETAWAEIKRLAP